MCAEHTSSPPVPFGAVQSGGSIGGPGGVCRSVGSRRADWPGPRRAKEGGDEDEVGVPRRGGVSAAIAGLGGAVGPEERGETAGVRL